ncbi:MAG: hypothetical protein IKO72_15350 [Kiritimatiellae bacterium]|nr:hypothetical protein [Kiritimatiellia bacterium]
MQMKPVFSVLLAAGCVCAACGRTEQPKLLIDVDYFDNLGGVRPYCGSNWIDRFFADCRSHGVRRVTWRCMAQIANYPSKLNYSRAEVSRIRSAADARCHDGAFAAKVGVGPNPPGGFGGIRQLVKPKGRGEFMFRAMVGSDALPSGAFLAVQDAETGATLARSGEVHGYDLQRLEVRFTAERPFHVGVFSAGAEGTHVFVVDSLSLRWLDSPDRELLANGDMEKVDELMEPADWSQYGTRFVTLNGDVTVIPPDERKRLFPQIASFNVLNRRYSGIGSCVLRAAEDGDSLALAGKAARKHGIELYAWYDPFDDGRRCLPPIKMWSDRFMEEHPEFRCRNREGRPRWGLLCFACPEVRAHKTAVVREILSYEGVSGIAFKTHYQHNSLWGMDNAPQRECLFHPAILKRYDERWGRPADGDYKLFRLRALHGEAVMEWLREVKPVVGSAGKRLCMFQAPNPSLDANDTCGWYLPPERIVEERLCDDMLIEPRWRDGDHPRHFATADNVKRLINVCRANGVGVGFDFYFTAVCRNWPAKELGGELYRQLTALAREDVDYLGIYEEMNIHNVWPAIGKTAAALAAMPPTVEGAPYKTRPAGLLTVDTLQSAVMENAAGRRFVADELVGDGADRLDGISISPSNSVLTMTFTRPLTLSEVEVCSGHLAWKSSCPAEDFTVEGLEGGSWRMLVSVKDASRLKGGVNSIPNTCRFERQRLEGIRITFTRSGHPTNLFLRSVTAR